MLKARTALLLLFLVAAFFPAMQAEAARETMTPIWQHVEGKEIERLAQEKLEALFLAAGETRRGRGGVCESAAAFWWGARS